MIKKLLSNGEKYCSVQEQSKKVRVFGPKIRIIKLFAGERQALLLRTLFLQTFSLVFASTREFVSLQMIILLHTTQQALCTTIILLEEQTLQQQSSSSSSNRFFFFMYLFILLFSYSFILFQCNDGVKKNLVLRLISAIWSKSLSLVFICASAKF